MSTPAHQTDTMTAPNALTFGDIRLSFGGLVALDGVSGAIRPNEVTAIIGPNGAGKTTLLNVVTGFLPPDEGWLHLGDLDITGRPPHDVALLGIGRTFQDMRLFAGLTVFDNVMASFSSQTGENPMRLFFRWRQVNTEERVFREKADYYLDFVGLAHKRDVVASDLSYGQQKRLALARVLANDARILMLDEPAAGLDPEAVVEIGGLLRSMVDDLGKTVCLIEHNLDMVREHAQWIIGMGRGRIMIEGDADTVFSDQAMIASYITGG